MERIREIQGTGQLRVRWAAVSQPQAFRASTENAGAVDMCIIAERKNSMESTIFHEDTQASDQLHAAVIAASI
jgi:hypothetical protein